MIAALPSWLSDLGAVVGILAAATVVLGFFSGVVVVMVRLIVKPSLDRINDRIDSHMGEEERQIDRIAIALDMIANALHLQLPTIRVSGGSDEGDTEDAP